MAIQPVANSARDAYRLKGSGIVEFQIIGIDKPPGMSDFASQTNRVAPHRRVKAAP